MEGNNVNNSYAFSKGNIFYFTQEKPLQGEEANFLNDIYTSAAFRKIKEECEKDPTHAYRVMIDQGYLSNEDFQLLIRYYKANMPYQDLPSNLIFDFTGTKEALADGYVPMTFIDADKEWFKTFKAACEENPSVIHTIEIEEGDRERGEFLDYVIALGDNLPDNARIIRIFNKAHDTNTQEFESRFKKIDFEYDPEVAKQIHR